MLGKRCYRAWRTLLALVYIVSISACNTDSGGANTDTSDARRSNSNASRLTQLQITPNTATMATGTQLVFTAIGTFADGSMRDVTALAEWISSNATVASVIKEGALAGRVTGKAEGSTNISVRYRDQSAQASLAVKSDVLTRLYITPNNPFAPPITSDTNALINFKAIGIFSTGFTQDLTTSVTWVAQNTSIASISNTPGSEGVARGLANGSSVINATATLGAQALTTETLLTVTTLNVVNLTIAAPGKTFGVGQTVNATASATFSDGSVRDVTGTVAWRSDNANIMRIDNFPDAPGLMTGIGVGTTTISATFPRSPLSAIAAITVTAPVPTSLTVTPATAVIAPAATQALTAKITFSNGTSTIVTPTTVWTSSNSAVATVSAAGLVTGVSTGTSHIKGVYNFTVGTVTGSITGEAVIGVVVSNTGIVDHATLTTDCIACHNGALASGKPATHIATTDLCATCHDPAPAKWKPVAANRVDHTQVIGSCASCHDGTVARGKSVTHINTTNTCDACHGTAPMGWKPVIRVDHGQTLGTCFACHNGTTASDKSATHIATTENCSACHSTTAWRPILKVDHTQVIGTCSSCHNGTTASGKPAMHMPTTNLCDACHSTTAWRPVIRVDHAQVIGLCMSCHNGSIAQGKPAGHPVTTPGQDCSACHRTTGWLL